MAFVDLVKSVYQDQHKAKPKALTSVEEGKYVRIQKQAKERRSRRIDTFFTNRDIEENDDLPLTPQSEDGPVPKKDVVSDPRKRQMLQWREERMKRKKMEPKKPPPFKVGVVKHHVAPLQDEIFKNPMKARPVLPVACHRVTRSAAKANLGPGSSISYPQKSFAPANAVFHAPKVTINEKNIKLKYTPKKARTGSAAPLKLTTVLNTIQPSKKSVIKPFDFKVKAVPTSTTTKTVETKSIASRITRNNKRLSKGSNGKQNGGNTKTTSTKGKRLGGVTKIRRLSVMKNKASRKSVGRRNSEIVKENIAECVELKEDAPKRRSSRRNSEVNCVEVEEIKENIPERRNTRKNSSRRNSEINGDGVKSKKRGSKKSGSRRNSEVKNEDSNGSKKNTPKGVAVESVPMFTPTNKRLSNIRVESFEKSTNKSGSSLNSSVGQNKSDELVISSPYVTVARGKTNQRRETLCKIKLGYSEMSPEKSAQYFRLQLDGEIIRLHEMCDKWRNYQADNLDTLPEDASDLINLAIGQTLLLINKKFQQFRGLVTRCENKDEREGEGIVTPQDLQGFWDMVYMQVENCDVRFQKLDEMMKKNWKEEVAVPQAKEKKTSIAKSVKPKSTKATSGLKATIQAARMKIKAAEPILPALTKTETTLKPETVTFNGKFFSVISPVKTTVEDSNAKTPNRRVSLLKTVVDSEAKKRRLSAKTPESANAILKASCLAKCVVSNQEIPEYMLPPVDLKKTPAKSILKTPAKNAGVQSSRKSLRVLFSDVSEEDSEHRETEKVRRFSEGDSIILTPFKAHEENECKNYIEEDLKSINVAVPELVKNKRRGRTTRQKKIDESGNDENVPPKKSENDEVIPAKIHNTRRRKSEGLVESCEGNVQNLVELEPEVVKPSRRSKRKSVDDGNINFDTFLTSSISQESTPSSKKSRRKSVDERQSINLISFSPVPQTRYTLRRMSTNQS